MAKRGAVAGWSAASSTQQRFCFLPNDLLAAGDFLTALLKSLVGDTLQVVNIIKINVGHEIDFRFNAARHGDVGQSKQKPDLRTRE